MKRHYYIHTLGLAALLTATACKTQQPDTGNTADTGTTTATVSSENPLWQSQAYSLYPDRIVQGDYVAKAISPTEITSSYQSPANEFQSPEIMFKFSINSKDNEMPPGMDHQFICLAEEGGSCETPIIKFGQQLKATPPAPPKAFLPPNTPLTVRVDMREVLAAFEKNGFYTAYNGSKVYKDDFKGVYIAGNTTPLSWDFDNLASRKGMQLEDPDGDGIYEVTLTMNAHREEKFTASHWKLSSKIDHYPQYKSDYVLTDALYNMTLEEVVKNIEADSTFRTGKEWAGVWTRDISYALILGLAAIEPEIARKSLMRKVKNQRIIQDTGTGGAYPVSTDRIVWGIAAWEIYTVTGDQNWLRESYEIIRNSVEDDLLNAFDQKTNLMRGESSFLDWREQTYPKWMQPADIYASQNLGTNAVHYQANTLLSQMATMLNDKQAADRYSQLAARIKAGINQHLWQEDKGHYGQYLYGRNYMSLSPRSEALGEALTVLFGIADSDRAKQIVANTPVYDFGVPSIFPQIPNIPPYHNNGIWPFVQAYWTLAAAKAGNETATLESLNAIYRPAALFLTNKENFVASNGDYAGTQVNSDRQLWSVGGFLGMTYKLLFGMNFQADQLVFKPFVPEVYKGNHQLTNFRYRNAVLNIEMQGFGNSIRSITLDGQPLEGAAIPASLTGQHNIQIVLANEISDKGSQNKVAHHVTPPAPTATFANGRYSWQPVEGAVKYTVLRNGKPMQDTKETGIAVQPNGYAEYQVIATDAAGYGSFASEPIPVYAKAMEQVYEAEAAATPAKQPYKGFMGKGFVEVSKKTNTTINFKVNTPQAGLYAIDFRYANGNGPINTDNKSAMRTLRKGKEMAGTIVLPQRGIGEWSDWGYTNKVWVQLEKGTNQLSLTFEPQNENMNGEINQAMIDHLRLIRIQ
ncbi:trehalase family glycosidase [Pontibacter sp. HSC-36F09]|uniref:alpha-L-rhamnosidase-related protein n=1 Tax=Pontibacter sp. HSC-36F09 TaxID=2910966 RepID=UPI00209E1685|nr:trehalase family glycosidase [Pontibacter sp. HSC-36F09]MCP2044864.1 glycogen debranching enzyme [Pontibacter sp. HSC-36F09]